MGSTYWSLDECRWVSYDPAGEGPAPAADDAAGEQPAVVPAQQRPAGQPAQ